MRRLAWVLAIACLSAEIAAAQTPDGDLIYYGPRVRNRPTPPYANGTPRGVREIPLEGVADTRGAGGGPPAQILAQSTVWRCTWMAGTGPGESLMRINPDGSAFIETQGRLTKGSWTMTRGELWIDFGEAAQRGETYLYKFVFAPDGSSLTLAPSMPNGNAYVRTMRGVRENTPAMANAIEARVLGAWSWSYLSAVGPGDGVGRFFADGTFLFEDRSKEVWKGTWTYDGREVILDAGLRKQMGDHYSYKLAVSGDSMTLASSQSGGNYYVRSLRGARINQAPQPGRPEQTTRQVPPPASPLPNPPAQPSTLPFGANRTAPAPFVAPPTPVDAAPAIGAATPASVTAFSCSDLSGRYTLTTEGIGTSTWTLTLMPALNGLYDASENGLGNARGTARLPAAGRISITFVAGNVAGTYDLALDGRCQTGSGALTFTQGRTGRFRTTSVSRAALAAAPAAPALNTPRGRNYPPGMTKTCQFTQGQLAGTIKDFYDLPGATFAQIGGGCRDGATGSTGIGLDPYAGGTGGNAGGNFAGTWSISDSGAPGEVTFVQDRDRVSGTYLVYNYGTGRVDGVISGSILSFTWALSDGRSGTGSVTLSPDGRAFDGNWTEAGNRSRGTWSGRLR